ncbi:hypothetical protein GCM10009109_31020 [Marinobacterium sediminicola]
MVTVTWNYFKTGFHTTWETVNKLLHHGRWDNLIITTHEVPLAHMLQYLNFVSGVERTL